MQTEDPQPVFLKDEGEKLLRQDVVRSRRCRNWLHEAGFPQGDQCDGSVECRLGRGKEQAIPTGSGASSGSTDALEEGSDGIRAVDLDDSVEVPDIDAQFEGAGRDDDAVGRLTECRLGQSALIDTEGTVGEVSFDTMTPESGGNLLDPRT